jgi:glyoxylase-like metal-dependent hydrolase (beta-lactamase superfamily II)
MLAPDDLLEFPDGITAVDAGVLRPRFDAVHILSAGGRAAIVDSGTNDTTPRVLAALAAKNIAPECVDLLLLTHVHLDHAGGAGTLMRALPNATAVLHPRGAPHMIDPAKLVAGSIEVYGPDEFRRTYGEIVPIPAGRVRTVEDGERVTFGGRTLELIHTPGHALHHYCIVDRDAGVVFSGDTFGVSYRELDTARGEFIFPTTTPVQFDPDAAHASIDRLLGYRPRAIFLTHFSRVLDVERLARDMHECLTGFVRIAEECEGAEQRVEAMRLRMYEFLDRRLDAHGVARDESLRRPLLEPDIALNVQGIEVWLARRKRQQTTPGRG